MKPVQLLSDNPGRQNWLWLPGWSYRASVFAPIFSALPGRHFGVTYPDTLCSLPQLVQALQQQAPASAVWVGWSLGAALAMLTATDDNCRTLVTLGCSPEFAPAGHDNEQTLQQFRLLWQQAPDKALKRFSALCAQGASDTRALIRHLQHHQLPAGNACDQSLNWLSQYRLRPTSVRQQHWYGQQDSLQPGGLQPAQLSDGRSHAFFLEQQGRLQLLTRLQQLTTEEAL